MPKGMGYGSKNSGGTAGSPPSNPKVGNQEVINQPQDSLGYPITRKDINPSMSAKGNANTTGAEPLRKSTGY